MPSIKENRQYWDGNFSWANRGDEWSRDWGSVPMQWFGTILPRIHRFLPAGTIVEIGCGYGRWTSFLKDHCKSLVGIDLSIECVEACRLRFAGCGHLSFHANDGTSLAVLPDATADFIFSFDALPLVDPVTLEAYIAQLPRVLAKSGVAFLHHSNLGEYKRLFDALHRVPALELILRRLGLPERNLYWRDPEVSATLVEALAAKHGLRCLSQEVMRWGTRWLLVEGVTVLARASDVGDGPCRRLRNTWFDAEAAIMSRLSRFYAS